MMAWAALDRYRAALQHPQLSFADPRLQQATSEVNRKGLPHLVCGGRAAVCRMDCRGSQYAVRMFLNEIGERRERYRHIASHLATFPDPVFAHFGYQEDGIEVDGTYYPILCMEWIGGDLLHHAVDRIMGSGNLQCLSKLAADWLQLLRTLEQHGIAHGDLQHGNIKVVADQFRLLDYDGMYVPALAGKTSLELGLRDYQHPRRTKTDFAVGLDRFAGLAILIALSALAEAPALWSKYYNGDNILFTDRDFKAPRSSPLIAELSLLPGEHTREWVRLLSDWCERAHFPPPALPAPPDPRLEALRLFQRAFARGRDADAAAIWETSDLDNLPAAAGYHLQYVKAKQDSTPPPPPPPDPKLEALRLFQQAFARGHDEEAAAIWAGADLDNYPAAAHFRVQRDKARLAAGTPSDPREHHLLRFQRAFASGRERDAVEIWESTGLSSYQPAARFHDQYQHARRNSLRGAPAPRNPDPRAAALQAFLRKLAQGSDREAIAIWEAAPLASYPPAATHSVAYQAAKRRIGTG